MIRTSFRRASFWRWRRSTVRVSSAWTTYTGSIEAGKEADIIIVNMWKPHLIPMVDGDVAARASSHAAVMCETVMVQGEILMEDRKVLTVDENDILEWAQKEAEHTWEVFGLHPDSAAVRTSLGTLAGIAAQRWRLLLYGRNQ